VTEALRNTNLALRFLLELSALAAVGYWGWTTGDGVLRPVLALAAVSAVAVVWGFFISPKATIELPGPLRLALELVVWVAAGAALYATGHTSLALVFVGVAVVSGFLNYAWRRPVDPRHNESVVRLTLLGATAVIVLGTSAAGGAAPSGLYGVVERGPIKPVCRADEPCDEPARGLVLVFERAGRAARVTTSKTGTYRIRLAPGAYRVRTVRTGLGSGIDPNVVSVPRGRFSRVDLFVDTGIR
jgi:Protein of unknown function (DUF2568)